MLVALAGGLATAGCNLLAGAGDLQGDLSITCADGACACVHGRGDCSETPGGTEVCETDLLRDPRNCGACGHSCLEGACKDGECQPFRFYFSEDFAADYFGIAGGRLFVPSESHFVMGVGLGGDLLAVISAVGDLYGTGAFVSGNELFFAGFEYPYWTVFQTSLSPLLESADVKPSSFTIEPVFQAGSTENIPYNIFGATEEYIYTVYDDAQMLSRLTRAGASQETLLTYDCWGFATLDDRVVWSDAEVVFELRDDQVDPVAIASLDGLAAMSGLTADRDFVYYTVFRGEADPGVMEVWELALGSGQKRQINEVETDYHYGKMAMDERYLYAVVRANGKDQLVRLDRSAPFSARKTLATSARINRVYSKGQLLYWGNLRDFLGVEILGLVKPID